jgi:oxygen-independent coproporphyrinogen-3 oxidase
MGSCKQSPKIVEPAGLYIHIPFCRKKCPYCDFFSISDLSLLPDFVESLLAEIHLTAGLMPAFDTIYLGGGTPSILPQDCLQQILTAVQREYPIVPNPEITLEVNPGTVTAIQLAAYRKLGINRLNIGVQSFQDQNLALLGRIHDGQQAVDAIAWARRAGFDNLGLDLICGLPQQSLRMWEKDLQQAVDHAVGHLACYSLTFEAGTQMDNDLRQGRLQPPSERLVADMLALTVDRLSASGYHRYEVSNFARSPALRSRHNQKYWTSVPYIGLGPSAHSWIPPERYWNHKNVAAYIADLASGRLPVIGRERLGREQMITETIMLGLRTTDGIDAARFAERFGVTVEKLFGDVIRRLEADGWLSTGNNRLVLTDRGMLFLDTVTAEFAQRV